MPFLKKILILVIMLGFGLALTAQAEDIDFVELVKETQIWFDQDRTMSMVWWVPDEYWEASTQNDPFFTRKMLEEMLDVFDDYSVFAIYEAEKGTFGSMDATTRYEILQKSSLTLEDGQVLQPLSDEELSEDLVNFLNMLKPVFANMMGQFGADIEFIAFPGKFTDGTRILDPNEDGYFSVNLDDKSFSWRLPLGSLLPPKMDPETKETFPGNYNFNPFTGKKLVSKD